MMSPYLSTVRLITICILFTMLFFSCKEIAAGSYPYAEYYNLDLTELEYINAVQKFKNENPSYKFMQSASDESAKEVRDQYVNNFYISYFYLADMDQVLHCVMKKKENGLIKLGLYAILDTNFGNLRMINTKDLSKEENGTNYKYTAYYISDFAYG